VIRGAGSPRAAMSMSFDMMGALGSVLAIDSKA